MLLLRLTQDIAEQSSRRYGLHSQKIHLFHVSGLCSQDKAELGFGFLSSSSPIRISVGISEAITTHFEALSDNSHSYKTRYISL